MQEINAWLKNGQDYQTGAELYRKYGKNSFFKTLLDSPATPYTTEKLEAELRALAPEPAHYDETQPAIEMPPPPVQKIEREDKRNSIRIKGNPEDFEKYLNIKEHQKTLYRQLERNMIELDLGVKESFLHMTAKNIISLNNKIMDTHKAIDYFDQKGQFPGEKIQKVYAPAEEIQNLRVSNWKARKRLSDPACRDINQTKKLIDNNNKRIIELGGKVKI